MDAKYFSLNISSLAVVNSLSRQNGNNSPFILTVSRKVFTKLFSHVNTILKRPKDGLDYIRFCDPTWRRSNGLQSLYSLESTICRDHLSCVRRLLRFYCVLRIILFYEIIVEHFQSTFLHVRVEYSFLSYCYE